MRAFLTDLASLLAIIAFVAALNAWIVGLA